jgi:hypothetical protein
VERHLGAPVDVEDVDVVDLPDAAHLHRRRMGALLEDGVLVGRLDMDDDVCLR